MGVTHFGKHADAGVRGSSAWTASADVVLAATARISEETGDVTGRRLALTKSRYAEPGLISGFDLEVVTIGVDSDGDPISAAVVRPRAATVKARAPSKYVELLLECIAEVLAKEPTVVGGRATAPRRRVRTVFGRRLPGRRDSGNATRAFNAAVTDAGVAIQTIGGVDYVLPPVPMADDPAVCAVAP